MKFIKNLFKKLDKKEYTDVKVDLSNILSNYSACFTVL